MLTINLEWDANASVAPQSFRDGVHAAAEILEAAIYNPITVNIEVGYGEIDLNRPGYTPLTSGESFGGERTPIQVAYPALRAALAANETSANDTQSVDALPNTASLDGQTSFSISSAQAKAFGVIPATDPVIDGDIGFPTSFTGSSLVDAAIVEEIHAMGLLNDGGDLGLFSYTSPGNNFIPMGITAATPAYFSIDGGITDLAAYDVNFDETLFVNQPNDPISIPTEGSKLTPLDLTEIDVIGFDDTSTPTLATSTPIPTVTTFGAASVNVQDVSVGENSSIPASSLIKSVAVPTGHSTAYYAFYDAGSGNGHFELDGVTEPDNQFIYVLNTQINSLTYMGGSTPGSETLYVGGFDYDASNSGIESNSLTATTTANATAPAITTAGANQATVMGAGNIGLTVNLPSSSSVGQVQTQLSAVSSAVLAGTSIANAVGSDGTLPALPSGTPGLAEIDNTGLVSLPAGYTTVIDLASGPSSVISAAAGNQLVVDSGSSSFLYSAVAGAETIHVGGTASFLAIRPRWMFLRVPAA